MKSSKQIRREAKQLFRICVKGGQLDEARARDAVRRVIEMKPRGYLAILEQFKRLVKLDLDRRKANVETAIALGPELQEQVRATLAGKYGAGLAVTFSQNPDLIAGMRIQVGSDVYDGTVQGRLEALQESF